LPKGKSFGNKLAPRSSSAFGLVLGVAVIRLAVRLAVLGSQAQGDEAGVDADLGSARGSNRISPERSIEWGDYSLKFE
jgi:hypothetical protein